MSSAPRRSLAAAAALVVAAALAACEWDYERMVDQERFEPYEPNPYFPDGKTMQRPPAGTVHRRAVVGPPALSRGVEDGREVEAIQVPVTDELLRRGRNRFDIFCGACHGLTGDGVTKVSENMTLRPPPSLHEPDIVAYTPGRIYRIITGGYGLMPSYAAELTVRDRWAVVAYVQALQLSQRARLDELPRSLQKEAEPWLR